jgi:hypothetical protein
MTSPLVMMTQRSSFLGWKVDLNEPMLEVLVSCNEEDFLIGLPLTAE